MFGTGWLVLMSVVVSVGWTLTRQLGLVNSVDHFFRFCPFFLQGFLRVFSTGFLLPCFFATNFHFPRQSKQSKEMMTESKHAFFLICLNGNALAELLSNPHDCQCLNRREGSAFGSISGTHFMACDVIEIDKIPPR